MDVALIEAVEVEETGLQVRLPDGQQAYFNAWWLRDNCPTSFDAETRERVFDIFHHAETPRPEEAYLDSGTLVVRWAGEGHVSRYPLEMLASYADGKRRHDPADLPRRPWFADHYDAMTRVSHPALLEDAGERRRWMEALLIEGVAIVTDMPDSDEGLTRTAGLLGTIRPSFFGDYFDVRVHVNPTNLAYTSKALEMHTDVPAEELAPGIQYLHCRRNSVEGGRNLFLDGTAVANDLRREDPEAFRLLAETEVPFYKEHDTIDMRARQRVIELDHNGEVSGVTISQHLADIFDLPQRFMDAYYPALVKFGRMLQDDKYVMRFTLRAGECISFDNHRVVHGRAAYSATSGERYLRGTYTDRGELRGLYRAMVSEGRFK
ncbi:TauD/TfdA family dioxygenase [Ponticoccus sp. SC2-23]|uniref:TauD/TfdA family dioxygenase n=1 Tax=Alexandriicola marinus TaxID=2081710 RepID=UPI000FDA9E0D|nr:TauD/TfdA family dioxygenase [Alexandriicola marinus]MBM1218715.1 TauD/TfdA family dioxygenase [Ponticoccus sp. SC6-9]MBM1224213.1 TauD/TfdA family dioxygenase [Ponticoccus sp. SC6-15]MBM1230008.1 TauD/TfdA family dioxygenase [Ponticoccus sp. SC6-38]MBM1233179.1 TauD/TfdA family dioxygenase [Ponticoccus sp. SC6-45]MBM1236871.1 TauD/TfdA family dioxygenase [Ponticoccus sp. SC6-49]MBM1242190.1 TauD/TfdA family dioxygenase [Ponticoccus sp. SC2-64]MBM1246703.1 TauD/TfdA family dioxygenase [Po